MKMLHGEVSDPADGVERCLVGIEVGVMTAMTMPSRETDTPLPGCNTEGLCLTGRAFGTRSHLLDDGPGTAGALLE